MFGVIYLNRLVIKKYLKYFISFFIVFFLTFIIAYVNSTFDCDDIWLFGFTSNLSNGLMIYRDFNVVTTPLYYFIGVIFLNLFGNSLIYLDVFNALIITLIVFLAFRIIKWKAVIIWLFLLCFHPNGYNLFSLFFLFIVILFINNNDDSLFKVGLVLGLLFINKQNIGLLLFIPYLIYSNNKVKSLLIFIFPMVLLSIYLILNNAFYEFIDYCFLGLFDFASKNSYLSVSVLIVEIIFLIYLFRVWWKDKFKNKEVFYIIMFQFALFPLANEPHFYCVFVPVLYLFLKRSNNFYVLFAVFCFCFYCCIDWCCSKNNELYLKNDIFYLKNPGEFPSQLEKLNNYIGNVDYYYFSGYHGYMYKLYYDVSINDYDLLLNGNVGYMGVNKRLEEINQICNEEVCLFILDDYSNLMLNPQSQSYKFYNYVVKNYNQVTSYDIFDIYTNYIE